jgi:DNA (cytosine-5)-methyltransferase 1
VGRVAYGVPDRAHRLAGLGNAVVPQIPEIIGRAILAANTAGPHDPNSGAI